MVIGVSTTNEVRQNGNYAISQMAKMITYARSFVGISVDSRRITSNKLFNPDFSTHSIPLLTIESFGDGQSDRSPILLFVMLEFDYPVASESASGNFNLINVNTTAVSNCYFTCEQSGLVLPPKIDIHFDFRSKSQGGGTPTIEKQSKIHFKRR